MIIKVPIYVDFDSSKVPSDYIPELSRGLSDYLVIALKETLKTKTSKTVTFIEHPVDGEPLREFEILSAKEALEKIRTSK